MLEIVLSISCLLFPALGGVPQGSLSELLPAHAAALQEFLSKQPELKFLSEKRSDQKVLGWMRDNYGACFKPFYQSGDFNNDGIQDFAVIVVKDVPPEQDPALAESHRDRYQVTIVIFNGMKGGTYRVAFVRNTVAPLVCFINTTGTKRKSLYYGVYETDEGFRFTPARRGYVVR